MNTRALAAILISALCTLSMRALPFLLLGKTAACPPGSSGWGARCPPPSWLCWWSTA